MARPTMLDMFAGIGGATIAGDALGIKTTQFVEIDPDAQTVLRHHWKDTPIHADIRDYNPQPHQFDIAWSSFPCSGTSCAGRRTGLTHPESVLWRESLRVICLAQPSFVVVEQPEGFIRRGLRTWLGAMRMAGYVNLPPILLSAEEVGAPQARKRVFVVSHSDSFRRRNGVSASWGQQVLDVVQESRTRQWGFPSFERRQSGVVARLPGGTYESDWGVPKRSPGRHLRRRQLLGKTVIPAQAYVPLALVRELALGC